MNEKLKPCPFCGGNNIIIAEVLETLYCDDCGCELAEDFGGTWNTRPIEDALTARIAELEKDNDEFRQLIHDWIIILTPDDGYVPDSECNDVATPIDVALRKRIAELEAERRWIPVSERLPDNWESVLTIDISKSTQDVVSAFYNPETSLWSTHFSCDLWVTHWMPLPESPIVYGKVCEE